MMNYTWNESAADTKNLFVIERIGRIKASNCYAFLHKYLAENETKRRKKENKGLVNTS